MTYKSDKLRKLKGKQKPPAYSPNDHFAMWMRIHDARRAAWKIARSAELDALYPERVDKREARRAGQN